MNKKSKIILFAVGITIFTYLVWDFGLNNILINLKKTGWYFIPVIGVWLFVYLFNALAWSFIIGSNKQKISFHKIFSLTVSGFAINYITPFVGLGGEPYRIAELKEQFGTSKAISSTILYSMIHFLSSFIFWILIIILALITLTLTMATKVSLIIALLIFLIVTFFFITRHKKGILKSLFNISLKIPLIKKYAIRHSAKEDSIQKIDGQITDLYLNRRINFYLALISEILSRIIGSFEFYFILKAIGIDITIYEALYINAVSAFMINLFFFMPLELGSREGGLVLVLGTLNITSSLGIYVGLVNRIRELFWILIGLILIALNGNKKNRSLLTEVDYEKNTIV